MISELSQELLYSQFLFGLTSQSNPKLYATCGIPGAGKSYFVDEKLDDGQFPRDAYILNPDRLMLALPEYQADTITMGAQDAYHKWELPVRELAYGYAESALKNRYNIIKDMGCANPLSLDLVKRLKSDGYAINMFYIYCDIDVAFDRINQREFQISQNEVKSRLSLLEKLLAEYKSIADEFITLDNTDITTPYKIVA